MNFKDKLSLYRPKLILFLSTFLVAGFFFVNYIFAYFFKVPEFAGFPLFRPSIAFAVIIALVIHSSKEISGRNKWGSVLFFASICLAAEGAKSLLDFIALPFLNHANPAFNAVVQLAGAAFAYMIAACGAAKIFKGNFTEHFILKCSLLSIIYVACLSLQDPSRVPEDIGFLNSVIFWMIFGLGAGNELSLATEVPESRYTGLAGGILVFAVALVTAYFVPSYIFNAKIQRGYTYASEFIINNELRPDLADIERMALKSLAISVLEGPNWLKQERAGNSISFKADDEKPSADVGSQEENKVADEPEPDDKDYYHSQLEVYVLQKGTVRHNLQEKRGEIQSARAPQFTARYNRQRYQELEDLRSEARLNIAGKHYVLELVEKAFPATEGELIRKFISELNKAAVSTEPATN